MVSVIFLAAVAFLVLHVFRTICNVLEAALVVEKIADADLNLKKYERSYKDTVDLSVKNYQISHACVEASLAQVFALLKQKRDLINECKEISPSAMLCSETRNAVLAELQREAVIDLQPSWAEVIMARLEMVVVYFTTERAKSVASLSAARRVRDSRSTVRGVA